MKNGVSAEALQGRVGTSDQGFRGCIYTKPSAAKLPENAGTDEVTALTSSDTSNEHKQS